MMKTDTQHLDFLISQYVDGTLEGSGRKSMEQKLLTDPEARKLYADHREVQDLLDDWGNRIPLINWEDFDQKLAGRLERETVGGNARWQLRRWMRPVAAAAALFIAASIGYNWHDWWGPKASHVDRPAAGDVAQTPRTEVHYLEGQSSNSPSVASVVVNDARAGLQNSRLDSAAVAISPPESSGGVSALKQTVKMGMGLDEQMQTPEATPSNHVAVGIPNMQTRERKVKEGEMDLSFP